MLSKLIAIVAGAGFLVSLLVHFGTYLGINAGEEFHEIWMLHILAIVIFALGVFSTNRLFPEGSRGWKTITAHYPHWGRRLLMIATGYAVLNFAVFFLDGVGREIPQRLTGTFAIYSGENSNRVLVNLDDARDREIVQLDQVPVLRGIRGGSVSIYNVSFG